MKTKNQYKPLLIEYKGTTLEHRDNCCYDCGKDFGVRYAEAVRALGDEGQPIVYQLCARCARKEMAETRTGMRAWPRYWHNVGMALAVLSMLCVPAALVELALWGFHVIGEPLVGWCWLDCIPAFFTGCTIIGAASTYAPWRKK